MEFGHQFVIISKKVMLISLSIMMGCVKYHVRVDIVWQDFAIHPVM